MPKDEKKRLRNSSNKLRRDVLDSKNSSRCNNELSKSKPSRLNVSIESEK